MPRGRGGGRRGGGRAAAAQPDGAQNDRPARGRRPANNDDEHNDQPGPANAQAAQPRRSARIRQAVEAAANPAAPLANPVVARAVARAAAAAPHNVRNGRMMGPGAPPADPRPPRAVPPRADAPNVHVHNPAPFRVPRDVVHFGGRQFVLPPPPRRFVLPRGLDQVIRDIGRQHGHRIRDFRLDEDEDEMIDDEEEEVDGEDDNDRAMALHDELLDLMEGEERDLMDMEEDAFADDEDDAFREHLRDWAGDDEEDVDDDEEEMDDEDMFDGGHGGPYFDFNRGAVWIRFGHHGLDHVGMAPNELFVPPGERRPAFDPVFEPPRRDGQGNKRRADDKKCGDKRARLDGDAPPPLDPNAATFNDLPDNVMASIFRRLPVRRRIVVERVCARWRKLARNDSWTAQRSLKYEDMMGRIRCPIDEFYSHAHIHRTRVDNNAMRKVLERCGRYLTHIDLSQFRDMLDYKVCASIESFAGERLTSLSLRGLLLTNTSLNRLGRTCVNLRHIDLANCFKESVLERGLAGFLGKATKLTSINLSENDRFRGVPSLENLPPTMEKVVLNCCNQVSAAALEAARRRCPQLHTLEINSIDGWPAHEMNRVFCQEFTSLRVLRFSDCAAIGAAMGGDGAGGDEAMGLGELKNLEQLIVLDNLVITDRVFTAICRGCSDLRVFHAGNAPPLSENSLSELYRLRRLEDVDMTRNTNLTDSIVTSVAVNKTLKRANLQYCTRLTNDAVATLLANCDQLEYLVLTGCQQLTADLIGIIKEAMDKRKDRHGDAAVALQLNTQRTALRGADPIGHALVKMMRGEWYEMDRVRNAIGFGVGVPFFANPIELMQPI